MPLGFNFLLLLKGYWVEATAKQFNTVRMEVKIKQRKTKGKEKTFQMNVQTRNQ